MKVRQLDFYFFVIFFLFLGSIFLPNLDIGFLSIRVSDILAIMILPLLFFFLFEKIKLTKSSVIFLFFIFSAFLSLFYSYNYLNVPNSIRDLNEILRYIILFQVLFIVSNINYKKIHFALEVYFSKTYFIFFIFGLLQYFVAYRIPVYILKLWGGEAHVATLLNSNLHRIFITGSDPNIGAVIASLYSFYFFTKYIFAKKARYVIKCFMMLIVIVMTSSRTTIIGIFVVYLFYIFTSKVIKLKYKIISFIVGIILSLLIFFNTPYLYHGMISLVNGTNNSILVRLSNFIEAINLFEQSPVFGWGPAKLIHRTVVDGEYFLILRRYGIVGSFYFLYFYIYCLKLSKKNINNEIGLFFYFFVRLGLFIMLTNNLLSGYQLGIPFMLLLANLESYKKYTKKELNCKYLSYYNSSL